MAIIRIENILLHSYHGCMPEEGVVGGKFRVDIWIDVDTKKAESSDLLDDTVDYVGIYEIVKEEMSIRSKLIETVGSRMASKISKNYAQIKCGEVKLTKLNPPVNGLIGEVSVTLKIK